MRFGSQTPSFQNTARIFYSRFRLKGGGYLMGELSDPKNSRTGTYESPRYIFRTGPKSPAEPGMVILDNSRKKYLLMDNGAKDHGHGTEFKTFKAVELTLTYDVMRASVATDPVTQRSTETFTKVATIDATLEFLRDMEDTLRVPTERRYLVTDFPLQLGDRIDPSWQVVKVETPLGVYRAEVQ